MINPFLKVKPGGNHSFIQDFKRPDMLARFAQMLLVEDRFGSFWINYLIVSDLTF